MSALSFSKVAIINRGEPAVRFLRALDEFNLIHNTNIKGVALYTDPDEHMPFVRQADEAISIGATLRPQPVKSSMLLRSSMDVGGPEKQWLMSLWLLCPKIQSLFNR